LEYLDPAKMALVKHQSQEIRKKKGVMTQSHLAVHMGPRR